MRVNFCDFFFDFHFFISHVAVINKKVDSVCMGNVLHSVMLSRRSIKSEENQL